MKRPTGPKRGRGEKYHLADATFAERFPTITEYMCDGQWDDGKPREVSTISINFSQGVVNIGLSDHALQQSAYTTADTITAALELLEAALSAGKVLWRPWKAGRGR